MNKKIFENARFTPKGDIEANWKKANGFVPLKKELILYLPDDKHPITRIKVGDGITGINELPFSVDEIEFPEIEIPEQVQANWAQNDENSVDYVKNRTHWVELTSDGEIVHKLDSKYIDENIVAFKSDIEELEKLLLQANEGSEGSEGLIYNISEDGTYATCAEIGTCSETDIIIASTYQGLPVTSIGDQAFRFHRSFTSVTIPDSVTSIGDYAFQYCSSLTSIVIPDSVTSIGYDAFNDCDSLTIYCEATEQSAGWNDHWNSSNRLVVWGAALDIPAINDKINEVQASAITAPLDTTTAAPVGLTEDTAAFNDKMRAFCNSANINSSYLYNITKASQDENSIDVNVSGYGGPWEIAYPNSGSYACLDVSELAKFNTVTIDLNTLGSLESFTLYINTVDSFTTVSRLQLWGFNSPNPTSVYYRELPATAYSIDSTLGRITINNPAKLAAYLPSANDVYLKVQWNTTEADNSYSSLNKSEGQSYEESVSLSGTRKSTSALVYWNLEKNCLATAPIEAVAEKSALQGGIKSQAVAQGSFAFGSSTIAASNNSDAFGVQNYAGSRGFKLATLTTDVDANTATYSIAHESTDVDIIDEQLAELEAIIDAANAEGKEKPLVSIVYNNNYDSCAHLISVNRRVSTQYSQITIDNIPRVQGTVDNLVGDLDPLSSKDTIRFPEYPQYGTVDVGSGAFTEGKDNQAIAEYAHAEGYGTRAIGKASHAEGRSTLAAFAAHAEGRNTQALGRQSHAEGWETATTGDAGHSEGYQTLSEGEGSHAEGGHTTAFGVYSHTEGSSTAAFGYSSHAEGDTTHAYGAHSHTEGVDTTAYGAASHTEGHETEAFDDCAHAEGEGSKAGGIAAHAEGVRTQAIMSGAHSEGIDTQATGQGSHAEGESTVASGFRAHAEGESTVASGLRAHAEGFGTTSSGNASHAEGQGGHASGDGSHKEGIDSRASGPASHAEGGGTFAGGSGAHAEGGGTFAGGMDAHAEGYSTEASANYSHAEGDHTQATGLSSHAEGINTIASGKASHAQGYYTLADGEYQTVVGKYNANNTDSLFAVGNGDEGGTVIRDTAGSLEYKDGNGITRWKNYASPNISQYGQTITEYYKENGQLVAKRGSNGVHVEYGTAKDWITAENYMNSFPETVGTFNLSPDMFTVQHGKDSDGYLISLIGNINTIYGTCTITIEDFSHTTGTKIAKYKLYCYKDDICLSQETFELDGSSVTLPVGTTRVEVFGWDAQNNAVSSSCFRFKMVTLSALGRHNAFEVLQDNSIKIGDTVLTENQLKTVLDLLNSGKLQKMIDFIDSIEV
jgi:hypothetical protein